MTAFVLRRGPQGGELVREPLGRLYSPVFLLEQDFPGDVPHGNQPFLDPNLQGHYGQ